MAQFDQRRTHALSLDDIVAARAQHELLNDESDRHDDDEQNRKSRPFADTVEIAGSAVYQLINLRRQRIDIL